MADKLIVFLVLVFLSVMVYAIIGIDGKVVP